MQLQEDLFLFCKDSLIIDIRQELVKNNLFSFLTSNLRIEVSKQLLVNTQVLDPYFSMRTFAIHATSYCQAFFHHHVNRLLVPILAICLCIFSDLTLLTHLGAIKIYEVHYSLEVCLLYLLHSLLFLLVSTLCFAFEFQMRCKGITYF